MTSARRGPVDVAIVGGGLAGLAMATRVAREGRSVVVLERSPRWRWHACGVFTSPAAMDELRWLGMAEPVLDTVARSVPGMRVETPRGTVFRLTYGAGDDGADGAVGFDREALDGALLALAVAAGAEVLRGHAAEAVRAPVGRHEGQVTTRGPDGLTTIEARLIVGADGIRSVVARDLGLTRPVRLGRRVALSWHVPDVAGDDAHDARMVVLDGAYCGLAPVPGQRLNVGIVLSGRDRLRALSARGAATVGADVIKEISERGRASRQQIHDPTDAIAGAAPLGHRVSRRGGPGWALIGDAAGFLDPFTGEGLHRALVSARLAASVLIDAPGPPPDLSAYDRAMRRRFGAKDLVSLIVQTFLARPLAFEYASRRLADRKRPRETLEMVMGDLVPASRALDPRFLARLLAP